MHAAITTHVTGGNHNPSFKDVAGVISVLIDAAFEFHITKSVPNIFEDFIPTHTTDQGYNQRILLYHWFWLSISFVNEGK